MLDAINHRRVPTVFLSTRTESTVQQMVHVHHAIEVDGIHPGLYINQLYLHGRGLAGMWSVGALEACRVLVKKGSLTIGRIHGYSFGALAALLFVCDIPIESTVAFYHDVHTRVEGNSRELCATATHLLEAILPENAYIRCRDTLHVGYTARYPVLAYREKTWFISNEELIRYVVHSMCIPGVTARVRTLTSPFIDGAIGNGIWGWCKQNKHEDTVDRISLIHVPAGTLTRTPTRTPTATRKAHIDVELFPPWLFYTHLFSASDPHIDLLVIRGSIDMVRFLSSGVDSAHIVRRPS
jgi:hypothetical protein